MHPRAEPTHQQPAVLAVVLVRVLVRVQELPQCRLEAVLNRRAGPRKRSILNQEQPRNLMILEVLLPDQLRPPSLKSIQMGWPLG
jgi:hypothetical protein